MTPLLSCVLNLPPFPSYAIFPFLGKCRDGSPGRKVQNRVPLGMCFEFLMRARSITRGIRRRIEWGHQRYLIGSKGGSLEIFHGKVI